MSHKLFSTDPTAQTWHAVKVTCHHGYRGEERPQAVWLANSHHHIQQILKTWREPEGEFFLVEINETRRLLLRHRIDQDDWMCLANLSD
ncbi:MAG: hypothetical protein JRF07_07670 [Deltaproteobacteria bacterium]|jgi:hypothetical protein|nr:hypothetical protein [Deltaproteobacteria bacterium]MBW2475715.1 hypothetical protein [Deltaproteobacteria bacterium]MBW2520032.1 hypothetical protein [Deltaproteobacteria bacterium]